MSDKIRSIDFDLFSEDVRAEDLIKYYDDRTIDSLPKFLEHLFVQRRFFVYLIEIEEEDPRSMSFEEFVEASTGPTRFRTPTVDEEFLKPPKNAVETKLWSRRFDEMTHLFALFSKDLPEAEKIAKENYQFVLDANRIDVEFLGPRVPLSCTAWSVLGPTNVRQLHVLVDRKRETYAGHVYSYVDHHGIETIYGIRKNIFRFLKLDYEPFGYSLGEEALKLFASRHRILKINSPIGVMRHIVENFPGFRKDFRDFPGWFVVS